MLSRTGLGDNHAPNLLLVRSRGRPSASGMLDSEHTLPAGCLKKVRTFGQTKCLPSLTCTSPKFDSHRSSNLCPGIAMVESSQMRM